jgi:cytochrome c oxidase assembly protein Cox11
MEAPAALKPTRNFEMPVISFVPVKIEEAAQLKAVRKQRILSYDIFFELRASSS